MIDEKAEQYINFGQFFDMQKDASFVERLVLKKYGRSDATDEEVMYIEDTETQKLYLAYTLVSGWRDPQSMLTELTRIRNAQFSEIKPKTYISFPDVYLYEVKLDR